MLSKSLRAVVRSEGRHFLNDSIAEDLVSRISLKCSAQNLQSLAALLCKGKLDDHFDDHIEIMWLVSCSMECFKLYSKSTLHALLRAAFIAVLHEVRITASEFKSREFTRSISFLVDVFPDFRIDHGRLQSYRDKAVSTIRHVSKLFRESQHRAAASLAKEHERKTSWPGLVAVLRKEARKLSKDYAVLSGAFSLNEPHREKKSRNGPRNRPEREVGGNHHYQDFDDFDESLLVPGEYMDSDSDGKYSFSQDYRDYEQGASNKNKNVDHRQQRNGKVRERYQHSRDKQENRRDGRRAKEIRIDYDEVEVGSVRHGPRQGTIGVQGDQDSLASVLGGLESQDFPSAVVSSRTDDAQDDKPQEEDRNSIDESSKEHSRDIDADLGESVTLSDQLGQAKLGKGEKCVQDLHSATLALDKLGPDDPLDAITNDSELLNHRVRTRRKNATKRAPREASPIPDSEGVHVMQRKKRNLKVLHNPSKRRKGEEKNKDGQIVRRGHFTSYEDEWLIEGIRKYGWGSWKQIVTEYYEGRNYTRNPMSLKDRARTLGLDRAKYPKRSGVPLRGRPPLRERVREGNNDEEIEEDDE
ncbi:Myb [Gracilaria domingensis]|nr:Myb [Gracilaria domingensis]